MTSHDLHLRRPNRWFEAYLFDLDGTIYLGDELLPGARKLIDGLREAGKVVRFLSNNPTRSPIQYQEKLNRLGIPTNLTDITNTIVTTQRWLSTHHQDATLFVIGEDALKDELSRAGFNQSDDPTQIDIVVSSFDRTFDYRKLQIAFDAIWFHKRAILIQTNPDRYCPMPGGRGQPDCAAITAAITAATGVEPQVVLGKPSPLMLTEVLRGTGLQPDQCLMVGDRIYTDIQMAVDANMSSALVLTGESTLADVSATNPASRPTYVVERIDQLLV